MGCRSDYMEPNRTEMHLSVVEAHHDELDGRPVPREWYNGYHPAVYCRDISKELLDKRTAALCARLTGSDTSNLSLELQRWWRDHQAADAVRSETV
jgi:hypothetical protein